MRQYAVDLGSKAIRSNAVNADRVRTQLFAGGVVESRAKARGLSVDEYFRANLLEREVTAEDVAEAFLYLATARSTTGRRFPDKRERVFEAPSAVVALRWVSVRIEPREWSSLGGVGPMARKENTGMADERRPPVPLHRTRRRTRQSGARARALESQGDIHS